MHFLYDSKKPVSSREISLVHHWFEEKVKQVLRIFGAGVLAYGIVVFMFSYGQIITQELNYRLGLLNKENKTESKVEEVVAADNTAEVEQDAAKYRLTAYFSIVIPKISAASNIIPNVDSTSSKDYLTALQKGVAHAQGSGFPGQNERIFIFSHSTDSPANFARYNAVFYLLNKLEKGDKIIVFFTAKKYVYEVADKVVVNPTDIHLAEPKYGEEELVLMTCDPPGTTWKRLFVIAKPVK